MADERRSRWYGALSVLALDVTPAVALAAVVLLAGHWQAHTGSGGHPLDGNGIVELLAGSLALVWRRRAPLLVYAVAVACTCAYLGTGHPPGPVMIAPFAALIEVVRTRPSAWIAATVLGGTAISLAHGIGNGWTLAIPLFAAGWSSVAATFAAGLRVRRWFVAETEARMRWAQRTRDEEGRRRMAEERLQIAREVHDVVGHSLAVISLRAGVAEHLLDSRPDQARPALRAIRQVSKQALAELRVELATLRGDSDGAAERAPTPGLAALPGLVSRMRDAGLPVQLDIDGDTANIPDVVAAAAYRIVQESLTNVARHANSAQTNVRASVRDGSVEVEVADRGPGMRSGEPYGGGITGMRDRAAALGGSFAAGNQHDGGFRVWAALPLDPA
jgi:signal transduction histidine kinase